MSETQETPTGIKRLEKRKGRMWGFLRKEKTGVIEPLPPSHMTLRLRHLMMSSIKSMGNFLRNIIGESGMTEMFEYQAEEFATESLKPKMQADTLARNMIKYNYQPLGIEATFEGNDEFSKIIVQRCPLPQRLLSPPEFFKQFTFEQSRFMEDFGAGTLTARGEWPPKRVESCYLCKIVMPKIGEKLGFSWEGGLTDETYRKCYFDIKMKK